MGERKIKIPIIKLIKFSINKSTGEMYLNTNCLPRLRPLGQGKMPEKLVSRGNEIYIFRDKRLPVSVFLPKL